MTTTLVVHPDSSFSYYGYYLHGFEQALGPLRIRFSRNDLPALLSQRDGIAVLLADGCRIFIAADDHTTINEVALEWCDVYGMVNLDRSASPAADSRKVVPIGPGFGIRWRNDAHAIGYVLRAVAGGGRTFAAAPARVKAALKHQHERVGIEQYKPSHSDGDHVFFVASFWANHPEANPPRQSFVRVARHMAELNFEGGLVGDPAPTSAAPRPYSIKEYLDRTRQSLMVFNTPAVHGCLGWKLGEFTALGKAIISLPISRELPEPFEHGVHAHIVDGSDESLIDAIGRLRSDHEYRHMLESSAAAYYAKWLDPTAIAQRLTTLAGR